jgi:hypothetical protein
MKTPGQATASVVVQDLDTKVRAAATQGGPQAIQALMDGRAATKQKYAVGEIFDGLKDEPVKTMRALTAPKDSAVAQLKAVASVAPKEMPRLARAYLEELMNTATAEGGFGHTQKLLAEWNKLGHETKALLFQKPALIQDLDHFFQLAKKMGESPNPSGTALTLNAGAQLGLVFTHPATGIPVVLGSGALSKLLHSPTGVKALTRGMSMSLGHKPGAAAASASILKAAQEAGVPIPAVADKEKPQARGLIEPGNIDLFNRPKVANPNGGTSTVYSASFGIEGKEVLLPLSDEGRILSEDEALAKYKQTGKHLGIFSSPDAATAYAKRLHEDYAAGRFERPGRQKTSEGPRQ